MINPFKKFHDILEEQWIKSANAGKSSAKFQDSLFSPDSYRLENIDGERANKFITEAVGLGAFSIIASAILLRFLSNEFSEYDALLSVFLLTGMYLRSRWAAIAFLIYFIIGHAIFVYTIHSGGAGGNIVLAAIFIFTFVRGAIGTIKWNHLYKIDYSSSDKRWFYKINTLYYPINWKGWLTYILLGFLLTASVSVIQFVDFHTIDTSDISPYLIAIASLLILVRLKGENILKSPLLRTKRLYYINFLLILFALFSLGGPIVVGGFGFYALVMGFLGFFLIYLLTFDIREVVWITSAYLLNALMYWLNTGISDFTPPADFSPTSPTGIGTLVMLVIFSLPFIVAIGLMWSSKMRLQLNRLPSAG